MGGARTALAAALLALAAGLSACGGDEEAPPVETEGRPKLTVPGEGTPTIDRTSPDRPPAATTTTATTGGAAAPTTPQTGGTAPPSGGAAAPPDSAANDTPPPAGSPAERFEQACQEDPSRC